MAHLRVITRIADHQWLVARHHVLTEGVRQRRLASTRPRLGQPHGADKELSTGIDQGHQGHRRPEHARGQGGQALQPRRRGPVKQTGGLHGAQADRVRHRRRGARETHDALLSMPLGLAEDTLQGLRGLGVAPLAHEKGHAQDGGISDELG